MHHLYPVLRSAHSRLSPHSIPGLGADATVVVAGGVVVGLEFTGADATVVVAGGVVVVAGGVVVASDGVGAIAVAVAGVSVVVVDPWLSSHGLPTVLEHLHSQELKAKHGSMPKFPSKLAQSQPLSWMSCMSR